MGNGAEKKEPPKGTGPYTTDTGLGISKTHYDMVLRIFRIKLYIEQMELPFDKSPYSESDIGNILRK